MKIKNKLIMLAPTILSLGSLIGCGGGGKDPEPTPGKTYTINTPSIIHGSVVGTAPTSIAENGTANFVFKADSGYSLPKTVSVSGATFNYTTSDSQGTISLSKPTSNVVISDIECLSGKTYTINTPSIIHGSVIGTAPTSIGENETVNFVFKADSGYTLPKTVSVSGATFNYTTSGTQGTISLSKPTSNVVISDIECIVTFSYDTWENVISYANQGLSKLHEVYKYDCDNNTKFKGTLIGLERTIKINNYNHVVKVIGENHDKLSSDETKTASLTFDFTTYISGTDGNPIKVNWNNEISTVWSTSTLRSYMTTVKDLFPNEIKSALKTVKKQTYDTSSSTNVDYDEVIFPLSVKEVGYTSQYAKETTPAYKYYENETGKESNLRRKKYVSGGYPAMGDPYWFRSPNTQESGTQNWYYSFICSGYNGNIGEDACYETTTRTIAPAFSI